MNERELKKTVKRILTRERREKNHDFWYCAISAVYSILGIISFFGTAMYITFLFYYRKFSELPQWVIKVFVPKTADGTEVLVKFTADGIDKCNLAALILGILMIIFAIVAWIIFLPKRDKVKTILLMVSFIISTVGGLSVLFNWALPTWLKIVVTAIGSLSWFILVSFSMGEIMVDDKVPLGVYSMATAFLIFTTVCWIYAGAYNWWC